MYLKSYVVFQVLFFHTFGSERFYQQIKPIMDIENGLSDIKLRIKVHHSIEYAFSTKRQKTCISMAGDSSYFAEKFFAEVVPHMPPIVLLDKRNRFKCESILIVTEDVHALRTLLRKLPRFPTHRVWCFVNSNTMDELEEILKKNQSDFGDADFILLVRGEYNFALRIQQPDRILERIKFPQKGQKWPVIDNYIKTFSGKDIKYSTADCDIHSRYLPTTGTYWGLDWSVFKAIAEGMKLTPKLVKLPDPAGDTDTTGTFFNGTWEGGILGNIAHDTADIGFCGFVFESTKFRGRIRMGNPIRDTCIIYAVPRPKPNSDDWTVVFYSFTPTVHLSIGISIIVFASTIRSVANIDFCHSKTAAGYRSLGYCLNVAWGLVLQGHFPSTCKMGVLRPFLFLWALYSILIGSSFSSHLVSNFARPPYNPKPKTIKDLVKFGYEAPQDANAFPLSTIINPDEPNTRQWLNQIYTVNSHEQMVYILDTAPDQALLGFKYDGDVFIPYTKEVIPERVMDKYETMDECIATIYEGFAFRQGSPFLKPFNEYSLNLMQSGLLGKSTKDILSQVALLYPSFRGATKSQQSSSVLKPLSIFNLKGIFVALVLGHLIATLVLIGEVIYHFESERYRASVEAKTHN